MTTGLMRGLTLEQAGAAVCARATQAMEEGGSEVGVWTEVGNQSVLVGIARRGQAAATMLIPREEYDGLKLLELLGVSMAPVRRGGRRG